MTGTLMRLAAVAAFALAFASLSAAQLLQRKDLSLSIALAIANDAASWVGFRMLAA
jgi:hypothetical protein